MDSEPHPLHLLLFPFMAQSHFLPMVHMAKLFAAHGVKVTFIITPANFITTEANINHANQFYIHPIHLLLLPFPAATLGLPEGVENFSVQIDDTMLEKILDGITMLEGPFRRVIADNLPDAIITDSFLPWTVDITEEFNIPCLDFNGTGLFSHCADEALRNEPQPIDAESIVIPGIPHRIEMLKTQLPDFSKSVSGFKKIIDQIANKRRRSYGAVMNSFYELEPNYADLYRKVSIVERSWLIGPLSLCNKESKDKSLRGNMGAMDPSECLKWLDKKEPRSVIYVCFGSLSMFSNIEMHELALGLANSGHPFLWVVRSKVDEWMPDGYQEMIGERGLILRGWAPQILILNHEAVGCFMTHCGWNSTLESVTAGIPMITRPLFAEQFYNEKLIVEILRIGVGVEAKLYGVMPEDRDIVEATQIEKAVRRLMDGGEASESIKRNAKKLGEVAKRAIEEGGSSYIDIENLIQEFKDRRALIST